ncbi:protein of unknown function [endosymbiont DhMRE of Dentiscutata heterogama]|uniref:hypothetical protein n=1 Tax=endosymbiont DhMRE of Dentiscutata heterogama TaxID=1609546 RepID=UPI000629D7AC|nr:hypothetical protein [endosymbiont DhMRE of Dentiscutata heterogama]CFW93288.1 protein of unknown function [endosymbiont DhMRE of Dentiscutata heterogama]
MENSTYENKENKISPDKMLKETPETLSKTKHSAEEIAEAFLSLDPERKFFTKSARGNFRLQTMLHISQMLYCSKTGKPLFKDPMHAYPPLWYKLNKKRREELDRIMNDKEIKDKKPLIYKLYQEQGIKFTPADKRNFWGKYGNENK